MKFHYFIAVVIILSIGVVLTCKKSSLLVTKSFKDHLHRMSIISASLFCGTMLFSSLPSIAVDTKLYTNERYHTSLSYPADFIPLQGQLSGDRPIEAFVDEKDPDTSISIVYTPIPADFTRLTSFGGKDTLRQYILPSGEGVTTNVLEENIKGEMYMIEYVVSAPNAPTRHVQSIFALRPQESIIAINIQAKEETYPKVKDKLDIVLPSFHYDL